MLLNIFCAKCGTELEQASHWVPPLCEFVYRDAHPIAVNPCPVCANEARARTIAKDLLQDAIRAAKREEREGADARGDLCHED